MFVSYARSDADWARVICRCLVERGLTVFFDEWDVGPGDVITHRLEEAIRSAMNGIALVSPATWSSPWAHLEYAALLTESAGRGLRFVPVLVADAELPPFAAAHVWSDFRSLTVDTCGPKAVELADSIMGRSSNDAAMNVDVVLGTAPNPVTPPEQPAFVLCHVGADGDYALRLVLKLRAEGLPVWWLGDLRPGDLQFWQIRRQLRYAIAVIVLMSPESQESDGISLMIIEGKLHTRHFVPFLLHGERNYHLAHTWYLDARNAQLPNDGELAMLHRLHRAHAEGRPIEPGKALPAPLAEPTVRAVRVPPSASLAKLDGHLRAGEVRHADLLTTLILLTAVDRLDQGWMRESNGRDLPVDVLAGIDAIWSAHTQGRQGFRAQRALAKVERGRHFEFLAQQIAYGWRNSARDKIERHYEDFSERAGPTGFFPTLRNPQNEQFFDWHDQWTATVLSVHIRLKEWKET